jgi:hypothetical protein
LCEISMKVRRWRGSSGILNLCMQLFEPRAAPCCAMCCCRALAAASPIGSGFEGGGRLPGSNRRLWKAHPVSQMAVNCKLCRTRGGNKRGRAACGLEQLDNLAVALLLQARAARVVGRNGCVSLYVRHILHRPESLPGLLNRLAVGSSAGGGGGGTSRSKSTLSGPAIRRTAASAPDATEVASLPACPG